MGKIELLDEKTINKIAAGEVVERPASVVKELCENAIDSNATAISVEIKDGGTSFIRVTDNGCGIDPESIRTAFLRHATSKITNIDDLLTIRSLGFRGEALSSIAAVSQVELMTKRREDLCGIRYRIEGGREMSFDEVGIPDGTTIIVRNLFFNTPARRKFLKSPLTEGNTITELMEKLILSHPELSVKFIVNGKEKLVSAGLGDLRQLSYSVFGRDISSGLVEVDYTAGEFNVSGFVGKPEISRGKRNYEMFFVNGRYVKSNILSNATEEAYKPYLMVHKYPFVLLYIDIPSSEIDVNVHPAKTEIRFLNETDVYKTIFEAVTEGITRKELIPEVKIPDVSPAITQQPEKKIYIPEPFEERKVAEYKADTQNRVIHEAKSVEPVQETLFSEGFLDKKERIKHKIIGQVFDTYWIVEYDDKMYIIDQHACHEKVLYERIKRQIDTNEITSQFLCPAYIVSLSPSQAEIIENNLEIFREIGFEVEHFGGTDYAISAVPSELFGMEIRDYFLSILDDLNEIKTHKAPEEIKDRIATMACKAAVKGNMKMSYKEMDVLIEELLLLDNPYNCPHGRPTIISYSKSELEKLFKRIV